MNQRLEDLMYRAGLTAQGCWNSMDEYDHKAIEKFAELIVQECLLCCDRVISDPVPQSQDTWLNGGLQCMEEIRHNFEIK